MSTVRAADGLHVCCLQSFSLKSSVSNFLSGGQTFGRRLIPKINGNKPTNRSNYIWSTLQQHHASLFRLQRHSCLATSTFEQYSDCSMSVVGCYSIWHRQVVRCQERIRFHYTRGWFPRCVCSSVCCPF